MKLEARGWVLANDLPDDLKDHRTYLLQDPKHFVVRRFWLQDFGVEPSTLPQEAGGSGCMYSQIWFAAFNPYYEPDEGPQLYRVLTLPGESARTMSLRATSISRRVYEPREATDQDAPAQESGPT